MSQKKEEGARDLGSGQAEPRRAQQKGREGVVGGVGGKVGAEKGAAADAAGAEEGGAGGQDVHPCHVAWGEMGRDGETIDGERR